MKVLSGDKENRQFWVDSLIIQNKSTSPEIAWALTLQSFFLSGVTNTTYIKVQFDAANGLRNVPQSKDRSLSSRHPRLQSMVKPSRWRHRARPIDSLIGLGTLWDCRLAMMFRKKALPQSSGWMCYARMNTEVIDSSVALMFKFQTLPMAEWF